MNARLEAYQIITKVLKKGLFSNQLLKQKRNRYKDSCENVELMYMLVKGVIKLKDHLDYIASQYTDPGKYANTNIKIKILIYMALYQIIYCDSIPDHAAVNETVDIAKKLYNDKIAGFVNAVIRRYLDDGIINYPEDDVERIAKQYSFPRELLKTWVGYWGEENVEKLCRYYNKNPKLSIRINRFATDKKRLIKYFMKRDISIVESNASDCIILSNDVSKVLNDVAFSEGYYSIQDASAALVAELVDPQLYESVMDMFAAPGGKSTYLAELMNNTGEIISIDKFPQKIKKIKQAIERLQISNIKTVKADALQYGPVAAAYDKVLLDVPCSGWGVIQKKAELRWQINQDMNKLLKIQESALKRGSLFVGEEGYLIYSTCTLNRKENEDQVEKFLERHRNFKLIDAGTKVKKMFTSNGYLKTLPHKHDIDGAFAAKMQRIK